MYVADPCLIGCSWHQDTSFKYFWNCKDYLDKVGYIDPHLSFDSFLLALDFPSYGECKIHTFPKVMRMYYNVSCSSFPPRWSISMTHFQERSSLYETLWHLFFKKKNDIMYCINVLVVWCCYSSPGISNHTGNWWWYTWESFSWGALSSPWEREVTLQCRILILLTVVFISLKRYSILIYLFRQWFELRKCLS